jgi:hypothetical protein
LIEDQVGAYREFTMRRIENNGHCSAYASEEEKRKVEQLMGTGDVHAVACHDRQVVAYLMEDCGSNIVFYRHNAFKPIKVADDVLRAVRAEMREHTNKKQGRTEDECQILTDPLAYGEKREKETQEFHAELNKMLDKCPGEHYSLG